MNIKTQPIKHIVSEENTYKKEVLPLEDDLYGEKVMIGS